MRAVCSRFADAAKLQARNFRPALAGRRRSWLAHARRAARSAPITSNAVTSAHYARSKASVTKLGDPSQARGSAGGAGYEGRPAGEVGWRSGCLARRRAAVPGRDQGDLAAEPGQGLLVVSDQVLAVALVAL